MDSSLHTSQLIKLVVNDHSELTFLDRIFELLDEISISFDELERLSKFLKLEDYDSESFLQDIGGEDGSNIQSVIKDVRLQDSLQRYSDFAS